MNRTMMATLMNVASVIALILVLNSYQIKNVFGYAINNDTLVIISETTDEPTDPISSVVPSTTTGNSNLTESASSSTNHTLVHSPTSAPEPHTNVTLIKEDINEKENSTTLSSTTVKSTTESPTTTSNPQAMLIPPASVIASIAQLPNTSTHKHKQGQIIIR